MGSDEVRRTAAQVRQIGDDLRRLADQLLRSGAGHWKSTSAAAFRQRLAEEVTRVRRAANGLDDAADALMRHAVAVEGALAPGRLR